MLIHFLDLRKVVHSPRPFYLPQCLDFPKLKLMLKTKPQTIESKNANFYPSPIFFPIYGFNKEQMIRPYETYKSQLLAKFQPDLRFVRFDSDQYFVNLTNYPGRVVQKKYLGGWHLD